MSTVHVSTAFQNTFTQIKFEFFFFCIIPLYQMCLKDIKQDMALFEAMAQTVGI